MTSNKISENQNIMRFEEFFAERMRERGFDLKKLSEATGIAVKHLEALASGNFKKLPPAPYFRGYLVRLGQILDFDHEAWWQKLKDGGFVESSGDKDAMPKNRFIRKPGGKLLWAATAVVAIIIYVSIQLPRVFGTPEISIIFPQTNPATVSSQETVIVGSVRGGDELQINGEFVQLENGGNWSKTVLLQSGLNSFEISAGKFLGGKAVVIQQIIYQPPTTTSPFGIDPHT